MWSPFWHSFCIYIQYVHKNIQLHMYTASCYDSLYTVYILMYSMYTALCHYVESHDVLHIFILSMYTTPLCTLHHDTLSSTFYHYAHRIMSLWVKHHERFILPMKMNTVTSNSTVPAHKHKSKIISACFADVFLPVTRDIVSVFTSAVTLPNYFELG